MKIGVDARAAIWYRGTGIGTYTFQLIKNLYLLDKVNQYRFFWPGDEYANLDIGSNSIFNSIEKSKEKFWEEIHIPNCLENEKIDLYLVPQNGIGLPAKKKCQMVVTIHDLIPYVYPETVGRSYLKVFLEEMPRVVEESDMIITVSQCSKADIQRIFKVPDEKIAITYEAAESIYKPMDKEAAKLYLKDNYGLEGKMILYLGGFSPRKNLKGLINAFYEIHRDIKEDYKLVLPGKQSRDFKDMQLLGEVLKIDHRIEYPGFVPVEDLPYFYNAAEIFVYPSFYEGFGLPPLEAMACGTPTITSNTSSIPEVVGDGAMLYNPFNTMDLADSLFKLINDDNLAKEYGVKGLKRAQEFTWEKTAKETLSIFEKLQK
jgi:glycosyltransferase involved in cell wall biosynthesis